MESKDWKEEIGGLMLSDRMEVLHSREGNPYTGKYAKRIIEYIDTLLEEARGEGYRSGLEDEIKRGEIYHNQEMADEGLMHKAELEEARKEVLLELLEKKTNYKIGRVDHGYKVTQEYVLVSDIEKELSKLTTR